MREIGVGIRIDVDEGLSFRGIEEVNGLINRGGRVTSVEPGGAIMRKLGEGEETVQLTLSGCELKVLVDDSGVDTSPQTREHDRLYREGSNLITPYMQLVDRDSPSADSKAAREQLHRGIELLNQALSINPANWSAYWIIGKAFQVLGDLARAGEAFGHSYRLNNGNADVAREYMFQCLTLGQAGKGIAAARHAVTLEPENAGLVANLALALLIGGELDEAEQAAAQALAMAPDDEITHNLRRMIAEVRAGRRPQPSRIADLDAT